MKTLPLAWPGNLAIGTVGILVPSALVWIAQHSSLLEPSTSSPRSGVAFGLILILASASRAPKTLRILGYLILISGVTTALTGLVAIERARVIIEWWSQQGAQRSRSHGRSCP